MRLAVQAAFSRSLAYQITSETAAAPIFALRGHTYRCLWAIQFLDSRERGDST